MYQVPAGYPQPELGRSSQRRGLWGKWLAFTCPPGNPDDSALPLERRELLRRAQLGSAIIAGLLFVDLLLLPTTLDQLPSVVAVICVLAACLLGLALNRSGLVTAAGYVLVLVLVLAVALVFLTAPDGIVGLDFFPIYDLLTIPLLVAASVLPRSQVFFIATINTGFIIADVVLQPHGSLDINTPDGYSLVAKPIVLQIILAVVSYLWARSMDRALRRADRAEELQQMEHRMVEQQQQLQIGAQQLLETHVRVANGDYTARAPLSQDHMLWQVAASLNNLITRIQRSGDAEFKLRRTEEEMMRVVAAIDDANGGRRPIWPAPTGTVVDELLRRVAAGQRPRQPAGPPPGLRPPTPAPPPPSFAQRSFPPGTGPMAPAYPEQADYGPHMPGTGSLGMRGEDGWPSLNTGAGGHASLATDNPWVLPADE